MIAKDLICSPCDIALGLVAKTMQDLDFSPSTFVQKIHRKACNVFITKGNLLY